MQQEQYFEMLNVLEDVILSACKLYLTGNVKSFSHKRINDILTDTDINMQKYLISEILQRYPNISIIAEENNTNNKVKNAITVCIDPLDGTCNFSTSLPIYGVQMAIFDNSEIVASIIYLPVYNEIYKTVKGCGVTLNGKKLFLNKTIKQSDSILLISDFYKHINIDYDVQFELIKNLQDNFLKTRLFGAASFDFASLLSSRAQAYICYYYEIWDIAPGLCMASEMGMAISGLNKNYELCDSSLVVGVNQDVVEFIKSKYKSCQ